MGMTCTLRRVNESDLRRLREAPEEVFTFLHGEPVELETVREPGLEGCLMRLIGVTTQQVKATAAADNNEYEKQLHQRIQDGQEIDIDNAWLALHFLLTGTTEEAPEPSCFLIYGGEEIGDKDDVSNRVLRPDQVSQFAAFLAELSHDELARRFDPTRMTALRIYDKDNWKCSTPAEEFDYLFEDFEKLKNFVTAASTNGDSVIVSIV